jgi:hypothetical protein
LGSDCFVHPAELVAYAVLLLTLAIVPLAFALHDPGKDPLFVGPASLLSSFLLVGLMTFSIRMIGTVSRRDA